MKKIQDTVQLALLLLLFAPSAAHTEIKMNVGGKYLPAKGTMRVLVVFAQFKDDDQDSANPDWPLGQLPAWSGRLLASEQSTSYPAWTVTDYYHQMSRGEYHVLGDIYPRLVTTAFTSEQYALLKKNFGDINQEILAGIDRDVDFRKYDSWSLTRGHGSLQAREGSDGIVEMVMVIFRTIPKRAIGVSTTQTVLGYTWSGNATLGSSVKFNSDEGVKINNGVPSSGVTVINGLAYGHTKVVAILAHEYGHYLFGEIHHFHSRGGLGLMGGSGPAMNAYERARLGYITLRDVTFDQMQELDDCVATGTAYRIQVSEEEFFIVENRQRVSVYDGLGENGAEVKPYGKGIYIFHVTGEAGDNLNIESAAGNWEWSVQKWFANPWDASMMLPLIVKQTPNPKGQDAFDGFTVDGKQYFKDFAPHPTKDSVIYTAASQGSEQDAFNVGSHELFAPWTNPSSNHVNETPTGVVVRVVGENEGKIRVWFSLSGKGNITGVDEQPDYTGLPRQPELSQNYPNPFNPETVISFQLPVSSYVSLRVFNLLGEEVATIVNDVKFAGRYEARWDGTNQQRQPVASGTYLAVLQTGEYRIIRKMSLVK